MELFGRSIAASPVQFFTGAPAYHEKVMADLAAKRGHVLPAGAPCKLEYCLTPGQARRMGEYVES
eukprot:15101029-Alexandrium_andersonii.AAC.1